MEDGGRIVPVLQTRTLGRVESRYPSDMVSGLRCRQEDQEAQAQEVPLQRMFFQMPSFFSKT
jgi:hypothetical protein